MIVNRAGRRALTASLATAAVIATWVFIGLVLPARELAMLAAAHLFAAAAFDLCNINTRVAVRRGEAERTIWRAEAAAATVALCAGAGLCGFLVWEGRIEAAGLAAVCLLGIPARFNGPVRARFHPGRRFRIVRNGYLLCGVAALALLAPSATAFAVMLAVREYATLAHALVVSRTIAAVPEDDSDDEDDEALAPGESVPEGWRGIVVATAERSKRRFAFLLSKLFLTGAAGPTGHLLASAGRGAGVARLASRFGRATLRIAAAALIVSVVAIAGPLIPLARQSTYWLVAIGLAIRIAATALHLLLSHWLEVRIMRQRANG